jgi:hypothetical protein
MENTASIPFWAEPSPKKGICGLRAVGMLVCSHGIYMAEAAARLTMQKLASILNVPITVILGTSWRALMDPLTL